MLSCWLVQMCGAVTASGRKRRKTLAFVMLACAGAADGLYAHPTYGATVPLGFPNSPGVILFWEKGSILGSSLNLHLRRHAVPIRRKDGNIVGYHATGAEGRLSFSSREALVLKTLFWCAVASKFYMGSDLKEQEESENTITPMSAERW